jgi:hypothetical protein
MPVFDLQLVQTHENALERLEQSMMWILRGATYRARRRNRLAETILVGADAYLHRYLGPRGYIARAARFDYPSPAAEGSAMPREFYSLVDFVSYSATAFPRTLDAVAWRLRPRYYAHLATRRFREVGGLGW